MSFIQTSVLTVLLGLIVLVLIKPHLEHKVDKFLVLGLQVVACAFGLTFWLLLLGV